MNEGRFVCQLFVDSDEKKTACDPCIEAQEVKDGKEKCCLMIGWKCDTAGFSDDDHLCCSGECGWTIASGGFGGEYVCKEVEGQKDHRGDTGHRCAHGGCNEDKKKCYTCDDVTGRAVYDDPATGYPLRC